MVAHGTLQADFIPGSCLGSLLWRFLRRCALLGQRRGPRVAGSADAVRRAPPPPGAKPRHAGPSQNFETPPKRSHGPGAPKLQKEQTRERRRPFSGRSLKGADNEARPLVRSRGKGGVWSLQAPNALKAACEALRKEFAEAAKRTRCVCFFLLR